MNLWLRHPIKMLNFKLWELMWELQKPAADPADITDEEGEHELDNS